MKQLFSFKTSFLALALALIGFQSFGQLYRTKKAGIFSDPATWEHSTGGGTFVPATVSPGTNDSIEIDHAIVEDIVHVVGSGAALTINAPGSLTITAGVSLTISGNADFKGRPVIFQSNSLGTARFGTLTGTLAGATNVTVQRYIPMGIRAYRQLAAGVNSSGSIFDNWQNGGVKTPGVGTHITGAKGAVGSVDPATGFDATALGSASLYTYEQGEQFNALSDTKAQLNGLLGYRLFMRGDRFANLSISNNTGPNTQNIPLNAPTVLAATGTLITGNVTYNQQGGFFGGQSFPEAFLSPAPNAFNLVANPYWSPVDFNELTLVDMEPTYYVWIPNTGLRGSYVSYNTESGSSGAVEINQFIQPGQSVFIQNLKNVEPPIFPTVVFKEINKSPTSANTFKSSGESPSRLVIKLYTNTNLEKSGPVQDATVAAFSSNFKKQVGREDASKFPNPDENIALVRNNNVLSIEGRPAVISSDTVNVRLSNLTPASKYTLKFEGQHFDAGTAGFVNDKFTNKAYPLDLNAGTVVPFDFTIADPKSYTDRFEVILKKAQVLPVSLTSTKAYQKDQGVQVEWNVGIENNINHYEVERSFDGQVFVKVAGLNAVSNNGAGVSYTWFDATALNSTISYYRIKVIANTGESKLSSIVKLTTGNNRAISVYPNPVTGGNLNVQFTSVAKGKFNIIVYSKAGQQMYLYTVNHNGGSLSETLSLPKSISSGIYKLVVKNGKEVINQQNILVEN